MCGVPRWRAYCHCGSCQRTHSAPYVGLLGYPTDTVRRRSKNGEMLEYNIGTASRASCKICHTTLYSSLQNMDCVAVSLQALTWPDQTVRASPQPRICITLD